MTFTVLKIICLWAFPTIRLQDDGDVVLDKGADVQQHSWCVNSAEAELYIIRSVIVAQAEIVVVRVYPVGPCCFVWYGFLSNIILQPRADFKVRSDVLEKIIVELDICSQQWFINSGFV